MSSNIYILKNGKNRNAHQSLSHYPIRFVFMKLNFSYSKNSKHPEKRNWRRNNF